jgi:hypothetical protein
MLKTQWVHIQKLLNMQSTKSTENMTIICNVAAPRFSCKKAKCPVLHPAYPSGVGTAQNKRCSRRQLTGLTSISEVETVWRFPEFFTATEFKTTDHYQTKRYRFRLIGVRPRCAMHHDATPLTKLASLYGHDTALLSLSLSLKQAHTYFFPP